MQRLAVQLASLRTEGEKAKGETKMWQDKAAQLTKVGVRGWEPGGQQPGVPVKQEAKWLTLAVGAWAVTGYGATEAGHAAVAAGRPRHHASAGQELLSKGEEAMIRCDGRGGGACSATQGA